MRLNFANIPMTVMVQTEVGLFLQSWMSCFKNLLTASYRLRFDKVFQIL